MRIRISQKVILLFILLLVCLEVLLSCYFFKHEKDRLLSEFDARAGALLGSLAASSEYPVLVGDRSGLEKIGKGILKQRDVVCCEIVDGEGDILFRRGTKDDEYIRQYTCPIVIEEPGDSTDEGLVLGFEKEEAEEIGQIRLALSAASLIKNLHEEQRAVWILVVAGIVLASVFITVLVRFVLSRPIDHLIRGTQRISGGDFGHKVPLKGRDEIGLLARSFNKMTEELQRTTVSRDYLDNVIGSMTDSLIVASCDRKINRVNQAVLDLLGYKEEELIGKDLDTLFPREERAHIVESTEGLITSGQSRGYEKDFTSKDGTAIPVLLGWSVMKDRVGNTTNIVLVAKDIRELKKTEQALRQSEERLRIAGKAAYDILYEWVVETDELNWFGDIDGVLGYEPGEIARTKQGWVQLVHPDDRADFERDAAIHKTLPKPISYEYRIQHKDRSWRHWRDSALAQLDDTGRPYTWIGVCADITERKQVEEEKARLEKQLQQAQKMEAIGTLAGGIAHDFNNILSAIIGYAEMAMDDSPKDSLVQKDLREVFNAGTRAKDLVKQILTFSRQREQAVKPIQVKPIIKEALKLLRASLPTTIEIRQDLQSDSIVIADPTQVHQILMNLCTNAGHAMQELGGILEVSLTDIELDAQYAEVLPGTYLKLTVSDTGTGMDALTIKRIFDPYFTTKEKGRGTGMGLAVVHGIVKSCSGTIKVYSEPATGSIFHVYLPVQESRAKTEVPVEESLATGTERILFIDDEQFMVNLQKRALESLGYMVVARTSSLEALDAFRAQPHGFDLVITDMTMPRMTGDKLAQELIKIRPDIPVILCTGFSPTITEDKAKSLGIRTFLAKPLLKRDLATTVRQVLDASDPGVPHVSSPRRVTV